MEKFNYDALLFRELRKVALSPSKKIDDTAIVKAVTLDENLKSLGYCFSPDSFTLLCKSDIDNLFNKIKEYVGEVKAEPMYKGFPEEVMEMDEATFRFHQLLHYMSTYGIELFTGAPVSKGWLPESKEVVRDKSDTFKTDLKVIDVVEEKNKYLVGAKTVLSRKTRLTNSQVELVKEAVKHLNKEELASLEIPFKENVQTIFNLGMEEKSLELLTTACKNPMDAFKCVKNTLDENKWHLRTSQKRLIAKLFDSFNNYIFEENLIYSSARREEAIHILDQVDYPTYSKNIANKGSLNALKDKKLKSWMSKVEKLVSEKDTEKLFTELKTRPGMFLRMSIRFIRLGYKKEVKNGLIEVAPKLSTQTLIDIMNSYSVNRFVYKEDKLKEWDTFAKIVKDVIAVKLASIDTNIKGKKVYIDAQSYDLKNSMILKSEEGGYDRGGLAFKLPKTLNKVRFFTYWNHPTRVDIDLHANCFYDDGTEVHIGWNGERMSESVVFSGDITHSDAAEYVDVDIKKSGISYIMATIHLFSGASNFAEVDTCFTGLMGVNNLAQDVKLYDPKACFVSNELMSKNNFINYGIVNLKDRYIRYMGTDAAVANLDFLTGIPAFSLKDYLKLLFKTQNVEVVKNKEDADITLSMAKGGDISIIDENFWVDL